jgi:hypothetical protein
MKNRSTSVNETPSKIISFDAAKRLRDLKSLSMGVSQGSSSSQGNKDEEYAYQARILGMDKLALLEEMVRFQENRSRQKDLSLEQISQGKYLFKALEERADTQELKALAKSYRRHLEQEYALKIQRG